MTWWRLLFLFEGCITRLQFWVGVGGAVAMLVLANALTGSELDPDTGQRVVTGSFLSTLLLMAGSWVLMAVTVKRLHDRGRSGWWALLYFVPFGIFWLLVDLGFLPQRD